MPSKGSTASLACSGGSVADRDSRWLFAARSTTIWTMDAAGRERAERRRKTWRGGKVSLGDADRLDFEFWQRMTPSERFVTVWSLSSEAYGLGDAVTPGLRGSASGIRSR